ncbi:glycosyltransferase family 4 protein [Agromyces ramosus]|uniref:Glycosyltransferase involved in cell wall biosynthesis n=1 Tax=Agromyces ramosus TaxID=33879 RepID=A0ABU0R859_9MICO|nr:glycosyltransferase family 4 protein [Agromyces ramosus]MDQ0893396.1 glycosyltransferase involved in cell wall biosynthesis [Agromyces ramosus]
MRIGIIAPPWIPIPPPAYGGIECFIDVLALELAAAGHEVVLAASGDSTCPVERLPGFPPSDQDKIGMTTHELRHLIRAYAGLTDVDVIVDNTLGGPVLAQSAARRPVVTIVHSPFEEVVLELYGATSPDMTFVAISRHQASTSRHVRVAEVIHHGIRTEDVPVGPGGPDACFLGRMHPDKGLMEAIEVAELAGIHLRIAAKMRESLECEYFEEVVRPALGSNAEYVGELSTDEKYELMGSSCALLNPIQWDEPFGLVMIEALATATPVVATPRGSVPEIVQDGGTGFIGADVEDLVDGLRRASSLDRGACRASVEERFTAAQMAQHYVALFERLLQQERQRRGEGTRAAVPLPTERARAAATVASASAVGDERPQTA